MSYIYISTSCCFVTARESGYPAGRLLLLQGRLVQSMSFGKRSFLLSGLRLAHRPHVAGMRGVMGRV